jgi:hypothetical protein
MSNVCFFRLDVCRRPKAEENEISSIALAYFALSVEMEKRGFAHLGTT